MLRKGTMRGCRRDFCLRLLLAAVVLRISSGESVEDDDVDEYFGVPLGALHFSSDGTSAEVYAADEFTIIFNHFNHNPRQRGCTAMMLGPARREDVEDVVEGHGLLLAPAHPPVKARLRLRRQAPIGDDPRMEQFRAWPVEFDHLLMAPEEQSVGAEPAIIHFGVKPGGDGMAPTSSAAQSGKVRIQRINAPRNATKRTTSSNATTTTTVGTTSGMNHSPSPPTTTATTTTTTVTTASILSTLLTTSAPERPITASTSAPETEEEVKMPQQPLILFGSKSSTSTRQSVKPNGVLQQSGVVVTSSGETFSVAENNDRQPTSAIHIQQSDDVAGDYPEDDFVRRAPARNDFGDQAAKVLPPSVSPPPATTGRAVSTSSLRGFTTPRSFWFIRDPREERRQRLLALRRKVAPEEMTTTTTTTQSPTLHPEFARFELPTVNDKLATFSLTNGAKINQYKWIGIYNQCTKKHIPLVSLRDIDPPREEKIMPLSGWAHNITSYRVHILNCNTILIPGFTYDSNSAQPNTFFFVGTGEFPHNIERQMKATVVGTERDDPLRTYSGEDVLLRLPRGFRTFDVDFISVYNVDEQKSYAHVILPSLLVPPCAED